MADLSKAQIVLELSPLGQGRARTRNSGVYCVAPVKAATDIATRSAQRRRGIAGSAGVTLIELLTAIMVAAIVTVVVLGAWQRLSWYIFRQESRSQLRIDTDRIAHVLSEELRRSREIVSVSDHEIVFVGGRSGDTIAYRLDWDNRLMRNDIPVHVGLREAVVEEFAVSTTGSGMFATTGEEGLVHISLQLSDTARGHTASAEVAVAARLPDDPFWNW
ncbi:MAG: hypothetical protein GF331_19420 [Chitinivibrionales bacterium]|nr:hypothetical protein [Chitinivibrionales bacterium]